MSDSEKRDPELPDRFAYVIPTSPPNPKLWIYSTGSLKCKKCEKFRAIVRVDTAWKYYCFVYCPKDDNLAYESWGLV